MAFDDPLWPTAASWLDRGLDAPDLAIVGVPTSAASLSPSDAWHTPTAVRELLHRFASFDGDRATDLEQVRAADWGDWLVAHVSAAEARDQIASAARALPTGPTYAFVGGDNMITHPLVANLPHAPLPRFGLLTLDAHHDVRVPPEDGPSNGSPVRELIEAGLPGDQVVQIGIHSFANSLAYRTWCEEQGVRVATARMVEEHGIARVVDEALDYLAADVDAIYVDCDLDVLDRAYAPACPGSRPGGLTPRQLATALRTCGSHPKVVAADFVEVDATRDVADVTTMNLVTALLAFASGLADRPAVAEEA